ncbi:hypothetical protein [Confluentibacter lentus]|uniref:hypothetical protein n=1 Tax=Confluentibacter lentus TaxID=1699412 RepID=UPI000C28A82A|nr:hypothetical protein [Confluentibacter lentus]
MGLPIPGFPNREYTKVKALHTFEAPKPYNELPTPILVARKKGEAWKKPLVVAYEPFDTRINKASIISVEKLEKNGVYKGLKTLFIQQLGVAIEAGKAELSSLGQFSK